MREQTVSEKFRELKPYIVDLVTGMITSGNAGSTTTSGLVAHALNGPYHTGTLSPSQFPQFGVHTADAAAHHAPVTAGTGITLLGQQVGVDESYGFVWTGQHYYSPTSPQPPFVLFPDAQGQTVVGFKADQLNKSVTAGNGLTGGGALTGNITLTLGTPSTLTVATTNSVSGTTHAHAITTSSNPGVAAVILASNASGNLTLQKLTLDGTGIVLDSAVGTLAMAYGVDSTHYLGLAYVGDCGLGGGGYAAFGHEDVLGSADYAIAQGGLSDPNTYLNCSYGYNIYFRTDNNDVMQMNAQRLNPASTILKDLGDYNRKWRTLFAAELYVETLVAQSVMATIGGRVMVAPTNKLIADLTNVATTIDVAYNNFQNGTYIYMSSAPGGVAQIEAMKVTSSATTISGGYRYTVTRNLDGTGANSWVSGDACVSLGEAVGQGYIDLTSTSTIHNHLGPTIAIYSRTATTSWNSVKAVVAFGNLRSFVDYTGDTFGWAVGNDLTLTPSSGFIGLTGDATNGLRLFNVVQKLYDGANLFLTLDNVTGLVIYANNSSPGYDRYGIAWKDQATDQPVSYVRGYKDVSNNYMVVTAAATSLGLNSYLNLFAAPPSGGIGQITLNTYTGSSNQAVYTQHTDASSSYMNLYATGYIYLQNNDVRLLDNSIGQIHFTKSWSGWPDGAGYHAEICNETTAAFGQLMIVGNKWGTGRSVGIWDQLQVGGSSFYQTFNVNGGGYFADNTGIKATSPDRTLQVAGTIHVSSSDAAFTTAGWGRPLELENGTAIVWKNSGSGSARGIGSTSNGVLYIMRSTANDASAGASYDMTIDTAGLVTVTNDLVVSGKLTGNWNSLSYTNAGGTTWTDFGSGYQLGQYKKFGDMVFVRGLVKRTAGSGSTIANLPAGYRPASYTQLFVTLTDGGVGRIDVGTGGDISLVSGSTGWVALNLCFSTL